MSTGRNFSITERQSRFVDAQVEAGRHASASEVEGLSAITGATITSRAVRDHLAAMLREPTGLLGQPVPMDCDR